MIFISDTGKLKHVGVTYLSNRSRNWWSRSSAERTAWERASVECQKSAELWLWARLQGDTSGRSTSLRAFTRSQPYIGLAAHRSSFTTAVWLSFSSLHFRLFSSSLGCHSHIYIIILYNKHLSTFKDVIIHFEDVKEILMTTEFSYTINNKKHYIDILQI